MILVYHVKNMENFIKRVILVIGLISAFSIVLLNLFYLSHVNYDELMEVDFCDSLELFSCIATIGVIMLLFKLLNKRFEKMKKSKKIILFLVVLIIYAALQVVWIKVRKSTPCYDQDWAFTVGEHFLNNEELPEWLHNYIERLPQQITLGWTFKMFFKIFKTTNVLVLQYMNVLLNILTLIGLLLIVKQIAKDYDVKPVKTIVIYLCFLPLSLLSTFVYGDLISITLCTFSVYFIMKYTKTNKMRYSILSTILTAIACIIRKNNLIYVIAIAIYLVLEMFHKNAKEVFKRILVLVIFVSMAIVPFSIIANGLKKEWNIDSEMQLPWICYIYMAMAGDNPRGNGWYRNDIMDLGYYAPVGSSEKYQALIKERLNEFKDSPFECLKFYVLKNASMWAENTYSSVLFNHSYYSGKNSYKYGISARQKYMSQIDDYMISRNALFGDITKSSCYSNI